MYIKMSYLYMSYLYNYNLYKTCLTGCLTTNGKLGNIRDISKFCWSTAQFPVSSSRVLTLVLADYAKEDIKVFLILTSFASLFNFSKSILQTHTFPYNFLVLSPLSPLFHNLKVFLNACQKPLHCTRYFTEEIFNGKLHFLCSVRLSGIYQKTIKTKVQTPLQKDIKSLWSSPSSFDFLRVFCT